MSLESSLWDWLRRSWRLVPKSELHYTRVENAAAGGIPDTEACYQGKQFWAELKVALRPASPSDVVKVPHFRTGQVMWLHNRWLVNGRAWLLLRVEGAGFPVSHYLIPGKYSRLVAAGVTEEHLARLSAVMPGASAMHILETASS